jgi:hypothetical protein
MESATAYQKNTGPVQALQGTGAGIIESKSEIIKSIPSFAKFPDRCDACGGPLHHEDLTGKIKGNLFFVKGYSCPRCRHKVGRGFKFNWERLASYRSTSGAE